MHVDTENMRSGAQRSHQASDFAKDAADALSRVAVRTGIFGSFAAAQTFHTAVSDSHSNHLQSLRSRHTMLRSLGDRTQQTASIFDEMERRNASALRAVP